MYRNSCQRGRITVFFGAGSNPLSNWEISNKNGYVSKLLDPEIKVMVLDIGGTNVSTTYITCPKGNKVLGISMPFLVMVVKNMNKYFTFEVTVLDDTSTRRRFRVANFQSSTQILPLSTVMPICLCNGWNQIQFNLCEFMQRAYNKQFVEVQKIKVNANIRLRRIYFADRLVPEEELPPEYRIFMPLKSKSRALKYNTFDSSDQPNIEVIQSKEIDDKKHSTQNNSKESLNLKTMSHVIMDTTEGKNSKQSVMNNSKESLNLKTMSHVIMDTTEEKNSKRSIMNNSKESLNLKTMSNVIIDTTKRKYSRQSIMNSSKQSLNVKNVSEAAIDTAVGSHSKESKVNVSQISITSKRSSHIIITERKSQEDNVPMSLRESSISKKSLPDSKAGFPMHIPSNNDEDTTAKE